MKHIHNMHKEAVNALKEAAEEIGLTYEVAKRRFTIEQNLKITKKFWEIFKNKNDVDAVGIEYCHGCKKFNVYVA